MIILFEEYNLSYSEVDSDVDLLNRKNAIDFDVVFFNKLVSFGLDIEMGKGRNLNNGVILRFNYCKGYNTKLSWILQLEDEWFLIRLASTHKRDTTLVTYKCDQFDGLVTLLKDKKFI